MRASVYCRDKYEAQKLANLIYLHEGGETHITGILNVVCEEVVIAVRDGSAHSVLFRDETHVERFADFVQSVIEHRHRIVGAAALEDRVEIIKE